MSSFKENALRLTAQGFNVFPLISNTKLPAESDFDDLNALPQRERIAMEVLEANENKNHELGLREFRELLEPTDGFFEGKIK